MHVYSLFKYISYEIWKWESAYKISLKVCCLTKMTFNKFNLQSSQHLLNVIQTAYLASKVKTLQKQE